MTCPCKDCTKRWVSGTSRCHSSCKEYLDWSKVTQQHKELLAKRKADFDSTGDVLFGHRRKIDR